MRPQDLVGFSEVVELLDVPRRTAARYVARPDFPAPYVRLAAGPIWLRAAVERWAKAHLPLRAGRPNGRRGRR
jgi:prophage regulatory protein